MGAVFGHFMDAEHELNGEKRKNNDFCKEKEKTTTS